MAENSPPGIESQLRAWADDLASEVPAWELPAPSFSPLETGEGHGRRRLLGAAALVLLVAVAAVAWRTAGSDEQLVADQGATVAVDYEQVQYTQDGALDCPGEALASEEGFDQAVFEAWADRDGQRWRMRVTYPDGTTRDVIAEGSPWYPTRLWERGSLRGRPIGCADDAIGALVAELGQGSFFSLNPLAEIPLEPESGVVGSPAVPFPPQPRLPAVLTYAELGELQPDQGRDSRGRVADVWIGDVGGIAGDRPVRQTTTWYVDAGTGKVLEQTYETNLHDIGVARSSLTLVDSGTVRVPADLFNTAGYRQIDT